MEGAERAHTSIGLELLAIDEDQIARALIGSGEQRAEHDGLSSGHQGLGDVARILQATVCDDRNAGFACGERRLVDRGDLGHADTGDDPCRANGARPDADLDGIRPRVDESLRARAGCDVATDDVHPGECRVRLQAADDVKHARAIAVGCVHDENVDPGAEECAGAVPGVPEEADGRSDAQAAFVVFCGVWVLLSFFEVLDRDEAGEAPSRVDQRKLLDLVPGENSDRPIRVDSGFSGDEWHSSHDVAHQSGRLLELRNEPHVTVRDDSDQLAVTLDDRQAGDAELPAKGINLCNGGIRRSCYRIGDHSRF